VDLPALRTNADGLTDVAVDTVACVGEMAMDKPTRSGERLRAMVQARLNAEPEVNCRVAESPRDAPVVGVPRAHERDLLGRNWNITELQNGIGLTATFRAIVDEIRFRYDIE
jgi:hypothetical protein